MGRLLEIRELVSRKLEIRELVSRKLEIRELVSRKLEMGELFAASTSTTHREAIEWWKENPPR